MRHDELRVGMSAEHSRTITEADVKAYAGVIDDFNPVHLDEEFAAKTQFKGRIAHGMLVGGLFSGVLATQLPGPGTIYLNQSLRFTRPVLLGDTVTARVEVVEILPKRRVRLTTVCRNQRGETVIDGEATVLVPDG